MREVENYMKKVYATLILLLTIISLVGCGYSSSYKATGFVHSNHGSEADMSFGSFDGRMVFKLKSSGEGDITYKAKLESGSAKVYYDYFGTKEELFAIGDGEGVDSHGGYVEKGYVYIIVETDEKCTNGEFWFCIE